MKKYIGVVAIIVSFPLAAFAGEAPRKYSYDIAVIERALASAKPGDPWVKFGDVGIKYADLKAYRDRLAGTERKNQPTGNEPRVVSPPGTVFKWPGGNVNYRFDPIGLTNGTIFKMTTAGVVTTLHTFNGSDGSNPIGALVRGTDGNYYGTTQLGGTSNNGTVFKTTTGGTFTTLYSFGGVPDGSSPAAGLVQASDGNFYGTTQVGGTNNLGTVFKITSSGTLTILYSFGSVAGDGANPIAALVQGVSGDTNLYGTTQYGGNGLGTVFKITTAGALTTLRSFSGSDGSNPVAGLVHGASPDTNFYGTTQFGGTNGAGTVFKITSSGTFSSIHSFNVSDGYQPVAGLIQGTSPDTNLYGTTQLGGASFQGTVFKITTAGAVTTLHSFVLTDGQQPVSSVVQATDTNFYGTVFRGGTSADGTAFKITSGGTFTLLHTFIGTDGTEPVAGFVQGAGGDTNFYGTTPGNNSLIALKMQQFRDGIAEWAAFANLHFTEFSSGAAPANFITVRQNPNLGGGFSSSVGMAGGEQFVEAGPHAWNRGTVCHEVGHALGLWHEQQRPDRDTYITINTSNIIPGTEGNFAIISDGQIFSTAYDFYSVMHYTRNTFAIDPNIDTIIMKPGFEQYANVIGNVGDRTLSKIERAGMATVYGNPSPLPGPIVTNTQDSGAGSLRTAVYYAFDKSTDAIPVATTILFNIPISDPNYNGTTHVFTIKPTFSIPALGNGTTIDGTSEATFLGNDVNPNGPEIVLDGSNFAALGLDPFNLFSHGLILRAANCTIKGLTIQNFNQSGIFMFQGDDPNGSATTGNVIGGTTAAARNVISGNANYGIGVRHATTTGNIIEGNYIGTSQTGTSAQPNGQAGVVIDVGAHGNTVGGTASNTGNVISGNGFHGVFIGDAGTNGNVIQGNFIGTNQNGTAAIPNLVGIEIRGGAQSNTIGGTPAAARNVISGNTHDGIVIDEDDDVTMIGTRNNIVQGNYIGLAANGTTVLPNQGQGIQIFGGASSNVIGGTASGASNVISGNNGNGVIINASNGMSIQGNYIGTDFSGTAAKPNGNAGVYIWNGSQNTIIGGTNSTARNIISGNAGDGLDLNGVSNTTVQGNYFGLDVNGAARGNGGGGVALFNGATSNTIGGLIPGARNIVSANSGDGVYMGAVSGNLVQGNYIGVNVAGTAAMGNGVIGVDINGGAQTNTIGGNVPAARNVIAASGAYDVSVSGSGTTGNTVLGNYIGLDSNGINAITTPSGNNGVAVYGGAQSNVIGGTSGGARNFISGHAQFGLFIADMGTSGNVVQGNTIGLNVVATPKPNASPGVALFNNAQMNTIGGSPNGASNIISGNSSDGIAQFQNMTKQNTFSRNSIFSNAGQGITLFDMSNNNQSAPTLASAAFSTVTNPGGTDITGSFSGTASTIEFFANPPPPANDEGQFFIGAKTGVSGAFSASLPAAVPKDYLITATATDANGNTSQFSLTQVVTTSDSNGDGLPDAYQNAHPGVTGANGDFDGDGLTNYQEMLAGSDPKSGTSGTGRFQVTSTVGTGSDIQITFASVAGKTYRIEYRDDLTAGSWLTLSDQIFATGTSTQVTDSGARSLGKRYYRAVVEP